MSKKPKKWTPWIPHTGDECPVSKSEPMKIEFEEMRDGDYLHTVDPLAFNWEARPCRHERILRYKRLRANVEAGGGEPTEPYVDSKGVLRNPPLHPFGAHTSKLKPKFGDPKPIITDPGEYQTRDGQQAFVDLEISTVCRSHDFEGWVGQAPMDWTSSGERFAGQQRDSDIIGPWEEPKTEEKPEVWATLYKQRDGTLWLGEARTSNIKDERHPGDEGSGFVGSVLLKPSHTEGEEG